MTARIVGFVTRADAGLRRPRSVSRNITPGAGGVAGHYGGPRQAAAEPGSDHARCVATWRAWQTYHMDRHGWSDIAYTGGFCNHGFAFAGRGVGVRTAANGTNNGNQKFYAVTWIGGEGQTPTQEAIDAFEWWVDNLRDHGAARATKPHRYFKPTGCPGNPMVAHCGRLDGHDVPTAPTPQPPPKPTPTPTPTPPKPKPQEDDVDRLPVLKRGARGQAVRNLQGLLLAAGRRVTIDGDFGPGTERELRNWQAAAKAPGGADGVCGAGTWGRLLGLR